jgi:hypothetical protein
LPVNFKAEVISVPSLMEVKITHAKYGCNYGMCTDEHEKKESNMEYTLADTFNTSMRKMRI